MPKHLIHFLLFLSSTGVWCQVQNETSGTYLQSTGSRYFIHNFDQSDKSSYIFFETNYHSIAKSEDHLMWIGTEENGIRVINGNQWDHYNDFPFSPVKIVQSDGQKMYFGGNNEFGWTSQNNLDKRYLNLDLGIEYHSLIEKVSEQDRSFGMIQNILSTEQGVFFVSDTHIFRYYKDHISRVLYDSLPFCAANYNNQLHVWQKGKGLLKLSNDSLQLVLNGELLKQIEVNQFFELDTNKLLIVTKTNELLIFTGQAIHSFQNNTVDYLKQHKIKTIKLLNNGALAVGTESGGVAIINQKGKLLVLFNKASGLLDNEVNDLFIDTHQNIWVAMKKGISRIEYPSPISWFNESSGIIGNIQALVEFEQKLYVATSTGLYFKSLNSHPFPEQKFTLINDIDQDCRSMCATEDGLFIAGSKGVFKWKNEKIVRKSKIPANVLYRSKSRNSTIFVGLENGLSRIEKRNGSWQSTDRVNKIKGKINNIAEDGKGILWLGAGKGCWKVPVSSVDSARHYIPQNTNSRRSNQWENKFLGKVNVLVLNGNPVFQNEAQGFWVYDEFGDSLTMRGSMDEPGKQKDHSYQKIDSISSVHFNNSGEFYFSIPQEKISDNYIVFRKSNGDTLYLNQNDYNWPKEIRRNGGFDLMCYTSDSIIWYALPNGRLCRYEGKIEKPSKPPYKMFITRISTNDMHKDKVYFLSSDFDKSTYDINTNTYDTIYKYQNNSIRIDYSSIGNYSDFKEQFQYQLNLSGEKGSWSQTLFANNVIFNNLPEGKYVFVLRAYNASKHSEETSFSFTILPPWYRTNWAYFSYGILFIGLIGLTTNWRTQRLQESKKHLEQTVLERTTEIRKQNQILRKQKEKIEVLLKELNHRVKNNLQIISSLLSSQSRRLEKSDAKEAVKASQNRVQAIALIHQNLYKGNHPTHIDMSVYVKNLAETIRDSFGFEPDQIDMDFDIAPILLDVNKAVPLGLIINEFVTNSFKYAFKDHDQPVLKIALHRKKDGMLYLEVVDNGFGLPAGFDIQSAKSYGLKLVNGLSKQLKADLNISHKNGVAYELILNDAEQLEKVD